MNREESKGTPNFTKSSDTSISGDIYILICSANLGNKEPTTSSINAMIPDKGLMSSFQTGTNNQPQQYDIIAIGVQEATFTESEKFVSTTESILVPVMSLAASVDHVNKSTFSSQLLKHLNLHNLSEMFGGTRTLYDRITNRLGEKYTCCLHYQRGGMRLMIMAKVNISHEIKENGGVSVNGENTGIGSVLPNKGGIVASISLRKTRISFLTAHLQAHEGDKKYKKRCKNMAEILNHAKVGPTNESRLYDASLSSHFCFVFGDLNFRLDAIKTLETHEQEKYSYDEKVEKVFEMIKREEWHRLHKIDELINGLRENDLLVGFETLQCCFPPTYKVNRGFDGYQYNGKRIPSYTDRILWKCAKGLQENLKPLFYDPCPSFTTSDHKPVCGGFSITPKKTIFNPQVLMKTMLESSSILINPNENLFRIYLIIGDIRCYDLQRNQNQRFFEEICNPYVMFVPDIDTSHRQARKSRMLDTMSKNEIIEKFQEITKDRLTDKSDEYIYSKPEWVRYGKPRTRRIKNESNPKWERKEDTILIEITKGNTIESVYHGLSGSMLYFSVMNYDIQKGDTIIGTVAQTMDEFCPDKNYDSEQLIDFPNFEHIFTSLHEDLHGTILSCSGERKIHEPLLRNGRVFGTLSCSVASICCSQENIPDSEIQHSNFLQRCGCISSV